MNADQIRDAINDEVHNLDRTGHYGASMALEKFSRLATNAELIRFREILIKTDQAEWVENPNNQMTA